MSSSSSCSDLKVRVHAVKDKIRRLFQRYDAAALSSTSFNAALRDELGLELTQSLLEAQKRPPLQFGTLLRALTTPDGPRSRRHSSNSNNGNNSNNRLQTTQTTTPPLIGRERLQLLFKKLCQNEVSGAFVRRELLKSGIELDDGRERLIDACEFGTERPFRDLVMAFAEPPTIPRPAISTAASSQCSPAAQLQRLQRADDERSCSKTVKAVSLRTCEMNNGDIFTWKDAPNTELGRRCPTTNSARNCPDSRSSLLPQMGVLMPRSTAAVSDAIERRYAKRRLAPFERQRLRQELPQHLVLRDIVAQPTFDGDDGDEDLEEPTAPRTRTTTTTAELQIPFGSDRDVAPSVTPVKPFSSNLRHLEKLIGSCQYEMTKIDKLQLSG